MRSSHWRGQRTGSATTDDSACGAGQPLAATEELMTSCVAGPPSCNTRTAWGQWHAIAGALVLAANLWHWQLQVYLQFVGIVTP